ncbi:MAG: HlyC/CorC family transporter [Proteobacteria bacterium]|nr:HlyC/CorC family transporter [Pseudomonadota bacterium]
MATSIFVLVLLIFCSAFFSGIESAFISLSEIDRIELEKSKSKNRKILLQLLSNRERSLSTILIGNNLANIAASAWNTAMAIRYAPAVGLTEEMSVTISAILLTVVILLFGEITPKTLALIHTKKIALWTAPFLLILSSIFLPGVFFFDKISKFLNKVFLGSNKKNVSITESTVINVVSKGEELGVINETERNLIQNVFLFDEREVYPIMTPRTKVFALEESSVLEDVKEILLEKQFSRIPIYKESIDNITGVIYLKTVFKELLTNNKNIPLKELVQKTIFIYETLSISSLLEQFQAEQNHMAIVVDEFGGMAGVVTLEDILEELVGEIFDEKDVVTSEIRQLSEFSWIVEGSVDIQSINKELKGDIEVDGEFETLQGLLMSHLERLPVVGDSFQILPNRFTVLQMDHNTVVSVKIDYLKQVEEEEKDI